MVFPVVMYGCESWTIKKAEHQRTVVLEKTLECSLASKEIQPVHPKGDQSWLFIGRTDAKAETPIVWPPDVKDWLIGKILLLGKIEGRRRRGRQRMRWLDGITDSMDVSLRKLRKLVWSPAVGDEQGGLACCDLWGLKESGMTEQLNWTEHKIDPTIIWIWFLSHYVLPAHENQGIWVDICFKFK